VYEEIAVVIGWGGATWKCAIVMGTKAHVFGFSYIFPPKILKRRSASLRKYIYPWSNDI
jgi:hypothetical protein